MYKYANFGTENVSILVVIYVLCYQKDIKLFWCFYLCE